MSEARAYAARNRQGSDWFGTAPAASAPVPSPVKATPSAPPPAAAQNGSEPASGRSQMIKPACNSNQWYKYDEKSPAAAEGTPKKEATKTTRQSSGDWYAHGTPKTDDKKDSKPRVMTTEGESYCRRDKAGTSATWFSHDHAGEAAPQGASGPRVTSKEGSGNASRMRGESENWFSHSASPNGAQAPTHVSKGRGVQPKSSEMHHIFHMGGAEGK